jgi:hypothetical protein
MHDAPKSLDRRVGANGLVVLHQHFESVGVMAFNGDDLLGESSCQGCFVGEAV